jgi:arsenite methyltransferase
MFISSRFGKFHARDRLLARLMLRGEETVLDVGCGHGILLIAATKLLLRGHAVGIRSVVAEGSVR